MSFWKSLFKIIAIILIIIAIIILIYAALVAIAGGAVAGSAAAFGAAIGGSGWALLAIGVGLLAIAAIISPEGFSEAVSRVGAGAEQVAEVVGNTIGTVINSTTSKLLSNPLLIGGLIAGAWFLTKDNRSADRRLPDDDSPLTQEEGDNYVYA